MLSVTVFLGFLSVFANVGVKNTATASDFFGGRFFADFDPAFLRFLQNYNHEFSIETEKSEARFAAGKLCWSKVALDLAVLFLKAAHNLTVPDDVLKKIPEIKMFVLHKFRNNGKNEIAVSYSLESPQKLHLEGSASSIDFKGKTAANAAFTGTIGKPQLKATVALANKGSTASIDVQHCQMGGELRSLASGDLKPNEVKDLGALLKSLATCENAKKFLNSFMSSAVEYLTKKC